MFALKGKCSALVMIESRRFPLRAVVTADASRDLSRISKLAGVDIGMAAFTCGWQRAEIDIGQLHF